MVLISLLDVDKSIFVFLNQTISNGVFDFVLPAIREKIIWIPLYVFILSFIMVNFPFRVVIRYIFFILITITVTDNLSSKVIKPSVERLRPCNDEGFQDEVVLRVRCGGGYSFTSSHAANHFGLSIFLIYTLGRLFLNIRWALVIWALAISIAQVYVGVHYPSDILFGAILGIIAGLLTAIMYNKFISDHIYEGIS